MDLSGFSLQKEGGSVWLDNNNSEFLVCNGAGKAASRPADSNAPLKTSRGMEAKKFKRCLLAIVQEHRAQSKTRPQYLTFKPGAQEAAMLRF